MVTDTVWGVPQREHEAHRATFPTLLVLAIVGAGAWLRHVLPLNVDVSWWLLVSERMLDGQRLYVDILETNPPMAGSAYFLAVALARAIHIRPELATNILIFALTAASLTLAWLVLRTSALRERLADGRLAAWTTALLLIAPMYDFGQREHLALITVLPAVAVYILRAQRERVGLAAVLVAGLSAGLTMSFKPYFAFAVGFCILASAAQARDWRVLFAMENWIAGALVLINAISIYVFFPEYFTIIYPLVRDVYLLLKAPVPAILVTLPIGLWLAATVIVLLLQRNQPRRDAATFVTLAASLGFLVSFVAQRKGWGYHAYPMVALALLAAGFAVSASNLGHDPRRWPRIATAVAAVILFVQTCVWFNGSIDVGQIESQVARLGPHPRMLVLSAAAVIGHPMVRTLNGTWISRQEAFWVREIVRRSQHDGTIDAQAAQRLQSYVERERAGIIADFRKQPPDIVLIDNQNSDWGDWARSDPELKALLEPYVLVQTVDGVEILKRG
ncbi:hypothetical protein [Bradyrhizobium sp. STM 3809]|uniref:hypothetical protein n=1 Tax=Bradyrhizobium sp. STM 3809 TaxID=551936 RepID=UPI0002409701|nr:hypothetical protein [Bradyrhizobium sp. STM 3809]CCD98000.1 conserved membrane hypothetical protein [Bradyrhizobium sp. STM 3809]